MTSNNASETHLFPSRFNSQSFLGRFGLGQVDLDREVEPQGFESGPDLPQSVIRGARVRNGDPNLRLRRSSKRLLPGTYPQEKRQG